MNSIAELVGKYVAAWSAPDAGARMLLLEEAWADDATYTDPCRRAVNRAELNHTIGRFLAERPGAHFDLNGPVDHHHNAIRFYWTLRLHDGNEIKGMDYGEIAADGRIEKIVGFF